MNRKLSEVQRDLQALADQVGAKRWEKSKTDYLAGVVVVGDDGITPLAPDAIKIDEIVVKEAAVPATAAAEAPDVAALVKAEVERATAAARTAAAPRLASASNAITANTIEPYRGRSRVFKSADTAYSFGMWCASQAGHPWARRFCVEKGLTDANGLTLQKVGIEGSNSLGGATVPPQFESTLIDLKEKYGVFSQYAQRWVMTSDTLTIPKRTAGLTAYFVNENSDTTVSDMTWANVSLTARKMAVRTKTSSELNEDSVLNLADIIAGEIAFAFAQKEDDCGFNGDGTSTYGGIQGIRSNIGSAGVFTCATGNNTYAEVLLSECNQVVGLLPLYAQTPNTAWYCSQKVWATVFQRLATAAGGVTSQQVQDGAQQPMFLGYPVRVSQVMPSTEANSQICALFGDLTLSSAFGDRRGMSIAMATQGDTDFAYDLASWRGTRRFDIVNHSVGDSSTAGPVVALKLAAS